MYFWLNQATEGVRIRRRRLDQWDVNKNLMVEGTGGSEH